MIDKKSFLKFKDVHDLLTVETDCTMSILIKYQVQ